MNKTVDPTLWVPNVSPTLASRWDEFVDCPVRLKTEGPFLQRVLGSYEDPSVLDAASGIGCESVWLTLQGTRVVSNEICQELRSISQERARMADITLKLTSFDWRTLATGMSPNTFDVVLLLGNSLCVLRNEADRRLAVGNLRDVCKPNGTLIVDERNFEYILSDRDKILKGQFRYSRKVMYCGTSVVGVPVFISGDDVRFAYLDTKTGGVLGTLDMHPFRRGELKQLLLECGFSKVETYSDLRPENRSQADFYTYVCCP